MDEDGDIRGNRKGGLLWCRLRVECHRLKANRWPPPRDRYSERGFLFIYLPWNKSPSAPSRGQRAAKDGFRAGQQRLRGRVA